MKAIAVCLTFLAVLLGCAPRAVHTSVTTPSPAPAMVTPQVPSPAARGLSPEEAAWAQVVDAAKKEGKVTAYSFSLIGDLGKAVPKAFGDKYGIKMEIVSGFGSVLIERLKSERVARKNTGDFFDSAPTLLAIAKDSGLTASVGNLPVLAEKDVWNVPPRLDIEGQIIIISPTVASMYVNTSLVKAGQEPKSYRELLDSKWKGKIGMTSPTVAPRDNYSYVSRQQLGLDDEYWRQLGKQDIRMAPSVRDADNMLVRGEVSVLYAASAITVGALIKQGAPIKAVEPEEGVIITPGVAISLVKDAPHPNASRLFINWLFTAEGQRLWSEQTGTLSVRKDVPDFQPPAAILPMKKVVYHSLNDVLELAKVQREGTLAKLLGLDVK